MVTGIPSDTDPPVSLPPAVPFPAQCAFSECLICRGQFTCAKTAGLARRMTDEMLDDLTKFSNTIATDISDLPATSPHGSDLDAIQKFLDLRVNETWQAAQQRHTATAELATAA